MHVLILANHRAIAAQRIVDRIVTQLAARRAPGDRVIRCRDIHTLPEVMAYLPDVVLAPLAYEGGNQFAATVAAVRSLAAHVPIIACCDVSVSPRALVAAAAAQVDHIAVPAVDDIALVVQQMLARTGRSPDVREPGQRAPAFPPADAVDALLASLPPLGARLLSVAISDRPPRSAAELASAVGVAEPTLRRRCLRAGWPQPRVLLLHGGQLRALRAAAAAGEGTRLTGALAALCTNLLRAFGVTAEGVRRPKRRKVARRMRTRRTTLASDGSGMEEGVDDSLERTGGAELERPSAGVPLELRPKRAG